MHPLHTPALLLRQVDTGESDRVVTLLTTELGKVSAIARGARKSRKRFGAALALFVLAEAELRPRQGTELYALTGYEARRSFPRLATSLAGVAHASYATELVRELCPSAHPEPELFQLLLDFYALLDGDSADPRRLRALEWQVLELAGLAPQLECCTRCGRPLHEGNHSLSIDSRDAGFICTSCPRGPERLPPGTHAALTRLAGSSLAEAVNQDLDPPTADALRRLLAHWIDAAIGKPLKSVAFIHKLNDG